MKETQKITSLILVVFAILAVGEILLYKNEMKLNQMISEGFMQVKQTQNVLTTPKVTKDGLMMQNGKMMEVTNGQTTMMPHDTTMKDGTKIMMNGEVVKKDGSKMMLKDGEEVMMDGSVQMMK